MRFYVLTWNPDKNYKEDDWNWSDFLKNIVIPYENNKKVVWDWRIGTNYKNGSIKAGTLFFLLQQGKGKRGIFGLAKAEANPIFNEKRNVHTVKVSIIFLTNPEKEFLVEAIDTTASRLVRDDGTVQSSGTEADPEKVPILLAEISSKIRDLDKVLLFSSKNSEEEGLYRDAFSKLRTSHHTFQKNVKKFWDYKCAVTGIVNEEFLMCSHIKPYSKCKTVQDATSASNGLYLNVCLDKAFDKFLISFDKKGKILLSETLKKDQVILNAANISENMRLRKTPNSEQKVFLEWHRKNLR